MKTQGEVVGIGTHKIWARRFMKKILGWTTRNFLHQKIAKRWLLHMGNIIEGKIQSKTKPL